MKYSEQTYKKALEALARLRDTVSDSEKLTIDFVAEAIDEKQGRDSKHAPTGNTEQKVGKWIKKLFVLWGRGISEYCWECSVCREKQMYAITPYCQFCGARMDGECNE